MVYVWVLLSRDFRKLFRRLISILCLFQCLVILERIVCSISLEQIDVRDTGL